MSDLCEGEMQDDPIAYVWASNCADSSYDGRGCSDDAALTDEPAYH